VTVAARLATILILEFLIVAPARYQRVISILSVKQIIRSGPKRQQIISCGTEKRWHVGIPFRALRAWRCVSAAQSIRESNIFTND
jgi:hypothetical protein